MSYSVTSTKTTVDTTYEIKSPFHSQFLRVARSFGDFRFKCLADEGAGGEGFRILDPVDQAVTCLPEIVTHKRTERDIFMLIACDGVWDVMTSDEAVQFINNTLKEEVSTGCVLTELHLANASDQLVQQCLDRGSMDNISVVLISFHAMVHRVEEAEETKSQHNSPIYKGAVANNLFADMNMDLPFSSPMKGTKLFWNVK